MTQHFLIIEAGWAITLLLWPTANQLQTTDKHTTTGNAHPLSVKY